MAEWDLDLTPTAFLIRMMEGANIDGVAQVLVYKRWDNGAIGHECFNMVDVDILGAAKYLDVSASIDMKAALTESVEDDD